MFLTDVFDDITTDKTFLITYKLYHNYIINNIIKFIFKNFLLKKWANTSMWD